jgi:hypothetical protein
MILFIYPWRGRTEAQLLAARSGYFEGLRQRISGPVLWKEALVSGIVFLLILAALGIGTYDFSVWAHSIGRKKDQGS